MHLNAVSGGATTCAASDMAALLRWGKRLLVAHCSISPGLIITGT